MLETCAALLQTYDEKSVPIAHLFISVTGAKAKLLATSD